MQKSQLLQKVSVEELFAEYFRPNGTFTAAAERLKIMNQNCLKRASSYSGSFDLFKNRHLSQLSIVDLNSSSTLVRGLNFGRQLNLSEIYHCWIWNRCVVGKSLLIEPRPCDARWKVNMGKQIFDLDLIQTS